MIMWKILAWKRFAVMSLGVISLATAAVAQLVGSVVPIAGPRIAGFFDATYAKDESAQHLGVDITAKENSDVRSPVDGTVVLNNTWASDINAAYIVIKGRDGEHVLGHIASTLARGAKVKRNQVIGKVRPWSNKTHVHWGINKQGVAQSITGKWGWGRAPLSASIKDATDKGWVNF